MILKADIWLSEINLAHVSHESAKSDSPLFIVVESFDIEHYIPLINLDFQHEAAYSFTSWTYF